jgi:hypothetical protein
MHQEKKSSPNKLVHFTVNHVFFFTAEFLSAINVFASVCSVNLQEGDREKWLFPRLFGHGDSSCESVDLCLLELSDLQNTLQSTGPYMISYDLCFSY